MQSRFCFPSPGLRWNYVAKTTIFSALNKFLGVLLYNLTAVAIFFAEF